MSKYISRGATTKISASSRISVKIRETYYTFEYSEERSFSPEDEELDVERERELLWNACHGQVDDQVNEVLELSK